MADFTKLVGLIPLFNRLDPEALQLFLAYGHKAMASGDPTAFVKRTLKQAIADEPVQAEFVTEVKPRRSGRRR